MVAEMYNGLSSGRSLPRRAISLATGCPESEADAALLEADGDGRVALLVARLGLPATAARERLVTAGGDLRAALGER